MNFLNYLDEKLGHYYNKYENIDSVKLNFILQLKALGLELGKLEAKDDKIYLNEKETLKATNIPMIANNKNLEMLKEERRNLEDKYYLYREKIKKEIDNDDILDEYIKIKNRKKEVEEEIYSLEQDILSLEETFIEITSKGKLSKRQIYAKKCLDEGDIEEAKEILSFNVLKEDGDKLLTLLE